MAYPTTVNNAAVSHASGQTITSADENVQSVDINALTVKVGSGATSPVPGAVFTAGSASGASSWVPSAIFNAGAYGALGDGTTNDTAAITATMAAAFAAGAGTAYLPGVGVYMVDALTQPVGVTLQGDGATLKARGSQARIVAPNGADCTIRGLTLDGNGTATCLVGLISGAPNNFLMEKCTLTGGINYGLQFALACSDVRLIDNVFTNAITNTASFAVSVQAGVTRCTMRGNTVMGGGGGLQVYHASAPTGCTDVVISDNIITPGATSVPIEIQRGYRVTVTGNVIQGGSNGISTSSSYLTVSGNTVKDSSQWGVELAGGSHVTITGNTLANIGINGVLAGDLITDLVVSGNVISVALGAGSGRGVHLYGSKRVTISGNEFLDGRSGVYVIEHTGGGASSEDVHIVGNTFTFVTTRPAGFPPTAVNIGNSLRTVVENNTIIVAADETSVNYLGPIIVNGTATDATIRANTILGTTGGVAQNSAIRVQTAAVTAGLNIVGNRIKNFLVGIHTSIDSSTDVVVRDNDVVGCTTAYTLNAAHQLGGTVGTGRVLSGTGVPAAGIGSNGDVFFRTDGTAAAHTLLYHKEAGAWVATAA